MKEKVEEVIDTTSFNCAKCRNSKNLYSLEQKNLNHEVIGIIFVCEDCIDSMTGKTMQISFGDDVEFTEDYADELMDENEGLSGQEVWN